MNITSVSNQLFTSATASVQSTSGTSGTSSAADPDGDGDAGRVHHGRGGGGHMKQAVAQALQSLGLTLPQSGATAESSSASSDGGSSSGDSKVQSDLKQFMHQLFEGVKAEGNGGAGNGATASSGSGTPQSGFALGLSSLISQVSNGAAPANLQSAFTQLTSDLSSATTSTSSTESNGAAGSQATLQAFLTQLQQSLGYSGGDLAPATGALFTAQV